MIRKKVVLIVVLLFLSIMLFPIISSADDEVISITFKEQNLYNTIVKTLESKVSSKIDSTYTITMTKDNLESVTSLQLNVGEDETSSEVSNLEGIEKFTNLRTLEIESTKINDISVLSNLTNLEELHIYGDYKIKDFSRVTSNQSIKDLTPISKLTKLNKLTLSGYNISDISFLSTLTKLTELDLMNNKIKDITPISKLTSLQKLYLSLNEISDISALSSLTNLEELDISGNQINDLTALSGLKRLKTVNSSDQELSITFKDKNLYNMIVKALENKILTKTDSTYTITMTKDNLESVTSLQLSVGEDETSSEVSNSEGIEKFTNLKKLEIESTKINDISVLSNLTNLEELHIYGDYKIKDFSRVTSNQSIKDLTPISKLTKLNKLTLSGYNISDISFLSTLTKLTELDLMNNKIKDITPISKLTSLQKLYLSLNEISDISALTNLTNLEELEIGGNRISDLTALLGLKKLKTVNLPNQEISITTNKNEIELPKIFAQLKNKNNIFYVQEEIKCTNCSLNSNKTSIKLNANAKEAKVYIGSDGEPIITLTIKYNGQSTNKITSLPYTGISPIVIPSILILSIIAIFLYMRNKKFKGL